jgi:hypothetical protein
VDTFCQATLQLLAVSFTARALDICSGADYILLVEKETGKCAKPIYVSLANSILVE